MCGSALGWLQPADYTFAFGDPSQTVGHRANNWAPIVGDWDGNQSATIGFFSPADSVFMLRNSLTTGAADLTFGYGPPGAGWLPLTGCWYTGPELPKTEPATSLNSNAVDQLDLAELVACGLSGIQ